MTVKKNPLLIHRREHAEALLEKYDNFLFDCDGVIWLDEKIIEGVKDTLEFLKKNGKKFAFVTNNSSKSRQEYLAKFSSLGIQGVTKDHIFPTCYAAVQALESDLQVPKKSKIWVLGDSGIEDELEEAGYIPVGGTDARLNQAFRADHEFLTVDPEVQAVVVGSTKEFNYMRIALTLQYLLWKNKTIPFIGCNIDRSYPGPNGLILPAGGSVVNYMQYTADRDFINVGKPSKVFLEAILAKNGFDRLRTLMVGDTLYTDIKFGNDGQLGEGCGSLLVLTGGTTPEYLHQFLQNPNHYDEGESMIPLYVIRSLGDFVDIIQS